MCIIFIALRGFSDQFCILNFIGQFWPEAQKKIIARLNFLLCQNHEVDDRYWGVFLIQKPKVHSVLQVIC